MNVPAKHRLGTALAMLIAAAVAGGCARDRHCCTPPPSPMGYASDPIWQMQEANAEASDFVIYDHEFTGETARLNPAGEDHVRQIAARVQETGFPVLVERSESSVRESDEFDYPVHRNPELDMQRRAVVVAALVTMGVPDAEERVVVAPAYVPGFEDVEAERAYSRALGRDTLTGFGGFFGGFGTGGFFGGF